MQFPASTPHVIANRKAAKDPDDKGSLYIERPDADRVIVTARSPGAYVESKVSVPWDIWLKIIQNHQ